MTERWAMHWFVCLTMNRPYLWVLPMSFHISDCLYLSITLSICIPASSLAFAYLKTSRFSMLCWNPQGMRRKHNFNMPLMNEFFPFCDIYRILSLLIPEPLQQQEQYLHEATMHLRNNDIGKNVWGEELKELRSARLQFRVELRTCVHSFVWGSYASTVLRCICPSKPPTANRRSPSWQTPAASLLRLIGATVVHTSVCGSYLHTDNSRVRLCVRRGRTRQIYTVEVSVCTKR